MASAPKAAPAPEPAKVAVPSSPVGHAGEKVTVACKLPHGLILQICDMVDDTETVPNGSRQIKRAVWRDERHVVEGVALPFGSMPKLHHIGGYALTPNIPRDFWERWLHDNADLPAVKNGMIFAHTGTAHVEGEAKEKAGLKSGLEPIDQEKDPRMPKRVTKVPANERAA